jgi:hypothetical protein
MVGITRNDRITAFVIEKATALISNEIKKNDGIVAIFGAKNRIKIQSGGDLFEERVQYQENSNTGWRDKFAQIPTAQQSNWLTMKYGQANISGSVVLNEIEEAQNASSDYQISNMLTALVTNANDTVVNQVAAALRAVTPGALEPNSVVNMIEAAAFGAQTTTTGGQARSTYPLWWQNQYSATAADTAAQAGLTQIEKFYWQNVAKGSSLKEQPDFGLTTGTLFASLSSYQDTLRRGNYESTLAKMGFSTLKILNAEIIADPSVPSGTLFLLNTNYLRLQVLRTKNMTQIGETSESIPLTTKPMQDDIDTLNRVQLFYAVMNLTTNSLQRQGRMASLT